MKTIEYKNQDIRISKVGNIYVIEWGEKETKRYDHSMELKIDNSKKWFEDKKEEPKHLFKVIKPSKFEIIDLNEETNIYLVKNIDTKKVFEISKKEFEERFKKI